MWQPVFRSRLWAVMLGSAIVACVLLCGGCQRDAPPEGALSTQPVAAQATNGGATGERVELDLETAQVRNGMATINIEVVPSVLPPDVGLVTLFVPTKARGIEPERVYAETQLQVQVGFPDMSTAAATTIMQDGKFRGQLTVWQRAADLVRDGEIKLQLKGTSMLKYEGQGRLYVWFVDAAKNSVSDRRDVKIDFGSTD